MKLLKVVIAFIALVSLQIASAQWLHVPPPVEARMTAVVAGGGVPVAGGGCTTSSDGLIYASPWNSDDGQNSGTWNCYKFTVSATDDITEYTIGLCDNSADAYSIVAGLYGDTSNEPDIASGAIAGTSVTLAGNAVTNCGDDSALHTFTLGATKVNIGVTTVWLCVGGMGDSNRMLISYDNGGTRVCSGNTGSWGCYDSYSYRMNIYGCSP